MRQTPRTLLVAALAAALLSACTKAPEGDTAVPAAPPSTVPVPAEVAPAPAPAPAGPFAPPSFDCAQAQGDVQTLVCIDQRLAELDREISRLFALADASAGLPPAQKQALVASQDAWIARRDACTDAASLRGCVLRESVLRIFALRQGYAGARSDDGGGISRGPSAWKCIGSDALLSTVFVNGEPTSLALAWQDRSVALEATPDPDGVRYAGTGEDDVVFLVSGTSAMFAQPGQPALRCEIEPVG